MNDDKQKIQVTSPCTRCGWKFPQEPYAQQWAALWDGTWWRMYPYIDPAMKWGPYCSACTGPIVNYLNAQADREPEAFPDVITI